MSNVVFPSASYSAPVHLLLLAASLSGVPARAAAVPGAGDDAPGGLAEIVVTAQKRAESLEKVPLNIVAVTGDTLEQAGIEDFSQMAARISGVVLNSAGPGRSSYSIRGIASVGGNAPTKGFYVDETPLLPVFGRRILTRSPDTHRTPYHPRRRARLTVTSTPNGWKP